MVAEWLTWTQENLGLVSEWLGVSLAIWFVSIVVTVVAVRYYLTWLPPDFFAKEHRPFDAWRQAHPLMWMLFILKNVLGVLLLIAGIVMLVAPGPGLLAILISLAMLDLPGKRALERRILARPLVASVVNRMRAKAGQAPLVLEPQ